MAVRKYRLLEEGENFRDTAVVTEMMDRQERLKYQQVMPGHQTEIASRISTLHTALSRELQVTADRLEAALDQHNRRIEEAMLMQSDSLRGYVNTQVGAIGDAIRYQQNAMAEAVREGTRGKLQKRCSFP